MRSNITLPRFNARDVVPVSRASYISAYVATRIGTFSRSASYELLAASLIRVTIFAMILATCALASASSYGAVEPRRPATPVQGSSSRKTVIDVRTSPAVYLPGPTFRIEVYSTNPVSPRVPERLQQSIEQVLLTNDPRLRVSQTAPDTSIVFTITDLTVSPGVETRTRPEYTKIGDTTVIDSETGIARTEDQYGYVDVPYRALVFAARMSIKCEVTDIATGLLLYSDRFEAVYTNARETVPAIGVRPGLGPGAVSVDDRNIINLKLTDKAASLILAQLSPKVYSEIVALSSGKLKEASTLLESGLWNEALTLLSSMPAFKDPKDDAYRLFSIGVAQEALAYKALDPSEKKRQLEQAVDNYRRAAELKPSENMFWAPKNRAESALSQTSKLLAQFECFEEAKKLPSTAISPGRIAASDLFHQIGTRAPSSLMFIDNQTVVQWVKSGRSPDYIIASIKHAPGTRFDLSEVEVLKLRRDGVNKSVLKAMADAQGRPRRSVLGRVLFTAVALWWLVPLVLR